MSFFAFLIKAWGFYAASNFVVRVVRFFHKVATSNKRYQSSKRHGAAGRITHKKLSQPHARELVRQLFEEQHTSVKKTIQNFISAADKMSTESGSNCIVSCDNLRSQAVGHAEVLDTAWSRNAVTLKDAPLFGLPISVKECYQVRSTASTHGLKRYEGDEATAEQESVLVCCCSFVLQVTR